MQFRLVVVALAGLVAGCTHGGGASSPAWPKPYVAHDAHDGGESLEPHLPAQVAAIEASEDETPAPAVVAPAPVVAPAATAPVSVTAPAIPPTAEEPAITEDITIEVED